MERKVKEKDIQPLYCINTVHYTVHSTITIVTIPSAISTRVIWVWDRIEGDRI